MNDEDKEPVIERIIRAVPKCDEYGRARLDEASLLSDLTSAGWIVVERFDIDEPIDLTPAYPPASRTSNCVLGTVSYLRLQLSGSRALREMNQVIESLETGVQDLTARLVESGRTVGTHKTEAERLQKDLTQRIREETNAREENTRLRRSVQAFERDIAKIRAHVGKKLVDEALAAEKS